MKYPLFLSNFNETWFFSTDFRENTKLSNLVKIRRVGAELFHADGRTKKYDETNIHFSQFCEGAYKDWVFDTSVKQS